MKVALLQTTVYDDKDKNLSEASSLLKKATDEGAEVAILPEMFNCPYETEKFPIYAEERGDKSYAALSKMAKENGVLLIGGSIPEKDGERLYNTSFVFAPDGSEIAFHRKAHMFDINIEGKQSFKESDSFTPGDKSTVFEYKDHIFGLAICFDIRFPELFRNMALDGAEAIFVPAAFNMTTGPMHWELAFRSRSVDNQVFTIGCAPARSRNGKYVPFAHSIVCNPWGRVICDAGENACVAIAEIDLEEVKSVRAQLPILSARKPEIYKLK